MKGLFSHMQKHADHVAALGWQDFVMRKLQNTPYAVTCLFFFCSSAAGWEWLERQTHAESGLSWK